MKTPLILASSSPRRRDLLKQLGLEFTIDPAEVDEGHMAGESPEMYAERVALDKAHVAAARTASGIVIAADTVVVLDQQILGKPADAAEAERMLSLLSGRQHRVMTGLALIEAGSGRCLSDVTVTSVWFRRLSRHEIAAYAKTGEPLDKAGGYGIQEKGALLVDRIEGCYFNVVGLPLSRLADMLKKLGFSFF